MQRGTAIGIDATKTHEEIITTGAVIGHFVTEANERLHGKLTRGLEVTFVDVKSLVKGSGEPYMMLACGPKTCRTSIKNSKRWDESYMVKINGPQSSEGASKSNAPQTKAIVSVMGWQKGQAHHKFGSCEINMDSIENSAVKSYQLLGDGGNQAGTVRIRLRAYDLEPQDIPQTHEITVVAETYCNLYQLEWHNFSLLEDFYNASEEESLHSRLPMLETNDDYTEFCMQEANLGWRRPTRPVWSLGNDNTTHNRLGRTDEKYKPMRQPATEAESSLSNTAVSIASSCTDEEARNGKAEQDEKIDSIAMKSAQLGAGKKSSPRKLSLISRRSSAPILSKIKTKNLPQDTEKVADYSPTTESPGSGVVKRDKSKNERETHEQRVKRRSSVRRKSAGRRNSLSVHVEELLLNKGLFPDGKPDSSFAKELKKSVWGGSSKVMAPTLTDSKRHSIIVDPIDAMDVQDLTQNQVEEKIKWGANLITRAQTLNLVKKDWDNVVSTDGLRYSSDGENNTFKIWWKNL